MSSNKSRDSMRDLNGDDNPELAEDDILPVDFAADCVLQKDAHGEIVRMTTEDARAKGSGNEVRYFPFGETVHCLELMRCADVCYVVLLSPVTSRGSNYFIRIGAFETHDLSYFSSAKVQTITLI
jgi:hypothetical protein